MNKLISFIDRPNTYLSAFFLIVLSFALLTSCGKNSESSKKHLESQEITEANVISSANVIEDNFQNYPQNGMLLERRQKKEANKIKNMLLEGDIEIPRKSVSVEEALEGIDVLREENTFKDADDVLKNEDEKNRFYGYLDRIEESLKGHKNLVDTVLLQMDRTGKTAVSARKKRTALRVLFENQDKVALKKIVDTPNSPDNPNTEEFDAIACTDDIRKLANEKLVKLVGKKVPQAVKTPELSDASKPIIDHRSVVLNDRIYSTGTRNNPFFTEGTQY